MGRMKPINGRLTIVMPLHSKGSPGPVPKWGMPAEAFRCGKQIGYQVVTIRVSDGVPLSFGWIFDNEKAAKRQAARQRRRWRRWKRSRR